MFRRPRSLPLFPYPPLSRSRAERVGLEPPRDLEILEVVAIDLIERPVPVARQVTAVRRPVDARDGRDRKSTRLNSSHQIISYAVFCLKKKNTLYYRTPAAAA